MKASKIKRKSLVKKREFNNALATVTSHPVPLLSPFVPTDPFFSQALRASEAASRVGGSAGRVAELLRATGFSNSDAEALGPWSRDSSPSSPRETRESSVSRGRRRCCETAGGDSGGNGGVGGGGATREWRSFVATIRSRLSSSRGEGELGLRRHQSDGSATQVDEDVHYHVGGGGDGGMARQHREGCGWHHSSEYVPPSAAFTSNGGDGDSSAYRNGDGSSPSPYSGGFIVAVTKNINSRSRSPAVGPSASADDEGWLLRVNGFTVTRPADHQELIDSGKHGNSGSGILAGGSDGQPGEPDGSGAIVRGLNLAVYRGKHLLVTGQSGCGKTSLLRSIAGLWEAEAGALELAPAVERARREQERPLAECGWRRARGGVGGGKRGGVMFLPQRPYCFRGTLFEQVSMRASIAIRLAVFP